MQNPGNILVINFLVQSRLDSLFSSFLHKRTCHAARRQPPTDETVPLTLRVTGSARGYTSTRKCCVSIPYDAACRLNLGHIPSIVLDIVQRELGVRCTDRRLSFIDCEEKTKSKK